MMRWAYILIRAVDLKYEIISTPSRRATAGGGMRLRSAPAVNGPWKDFIINIHCLSFRLSEANGEI